MEENKNSAQLEDEVIVESADDTEDDELEDEDDFEEEEYDFNDESAEDEDDSDGEEDESDESEEAEAEAAPTAAKEAETAPEKPVEAAETSKAAEDKPAAAQDDRTRAIMDNMLHRLGYKGTYEEKMAAYEADAAKSAAEASKQAESTEKAEGAAGEAVDYRAMAEKDLRDINAAFGTQYTDFGSFDDVARFAQLRVGGATALEAFRATQKRFTEPESKAEETEAAQPLAKPSKAHIKPLPTGGNSGGGSELSVEDKRTLAQLRGLYPELSQKELMKNLRRVKKVR